MNIAIKKLKTLSLLYVESDEQVRKSTLETLVLLFKNIYSTPCSEEGYALFLKHRPDIVLTDIHIQPMNGIDLVECIRQQNSHIPVIFVSAYANKEWLLRALKCSACDYLLKPFSLFDLERAFLKAVMFLHHKIENIITLNKEIHYDVSKQELYKNEKHIRLGSKEHRLLNLFIENQQRALSKDEIIANIWPFEEVTDSALKSVFYRIKKKVEYDLIVSTQYHYWKLNV